jgi:hypothetical protein
VRRRNPARRWCLSDEVGLRWSCDGEEGGEGELDAPRTKNGGGDGSDALGQRGVASSDRGAWTRPVRVAVVHTRRGAVGRRAGAVRRCRGVGGAGDASCRDVRRAVPTAALSRGVGAARGGHAATVRCRVGPARRTASDRWGPLVSDFRIKIHPEGN